MYDILQTVAVETQSIAFPLADAQQKPYTSNRELLANAWSGHGIEEPRHALALRLIYGYITAENNDRPSLSGNARHCVSTIFI